MAIYREPQISTETKAIMKDYIENFPRIARRAEYQRIADEIGDVTANTVRSWFSNRPPSRDYVYKLQKAVKGKIKAKEIRPDLF